MRTGTTDGGARVEIEGLSVSFGTVPAVRDLSLSIEAGELLVLVGPSGCGKSTVLRTIAGLERAEAGSIRIGDRRVDGLEPGDRDVAMVFQNYALYPHMTVERNIGFPLRMAGLPRGEIRERVARAAEVLGLAELLGRKPRALSGGQMQRVALGRAIVRDPAVFLFDEPLSNLDAKMRLEMRAEIARLHGRLGTTMVYVTHDQSEAMTLGDRIAVMEGGVLQQLGAPLEVYRAPANRFVAGFIGSPPMNIVPAALVGLGADGDVGIRPHDVEVDGGGPIEARIELVEPMGPEAHVHCRVGDAALLVVTREPPTDASLRLRFPEERVHRFA